MLKGKIPKKAQEGKKMKKKFMLVLAAVMVAIMILACAGAGNASKGESKIKGVYLSPAKADYNNMRPTYNFYLYNFAQSEVTLYENGTYMVIVTDSTFSAVELAESTNDHTENERTNQITKFFGTYTAVANELDDDLTDVTFAKPTRIVKSFDQSYWLDTDNWTEKMGKATAEKEYDGTTGEVIGEGTPKTAADYLAANAFDEVTLSVNEKTASLDFYAFGVKTGFQQ